MNRSKYKMIYHELSSKILNEIYPYKTQLPSEYDLVKLYSVSRETVRKALSLLQTNGFIQKVKGKGSIVIYQKSTDFPVSQLISFEEIKETLNMDYTTQVESFDLVRAEHHPRVMQALKLKENDMVFEVVRTRRKAGRVNIIDKDYFVANLMPDLNTEIASQSIYSYIEKELGLAISFSHKEITFEAMDEYELDLFENAMPPYAATVRSIVHLASAVPFQYNISKHRASEFKFVDFSRRNISKKK